MRIRFLAVLAVLALPLLGCNKSSPPPPESDQAGPAPSAGTTYVCPMDPDVTSDKPGRCPKCGMELVPEK
jgi:membrane fusion protein, copper/silver efflux system